MEFSGQSNTRSGSRHAALIASNQSVQQGWIVRTTSLAKGLLTWIPGVQRTFFDRTAAGGTASPAYCYGVWMKHFTLLSAHGMAPPRAVLELGPGASVGTGIAALLSGAERYVGIDAVAHMKAAANAEALWGLVHLFRNRAPRPVAGFPDFDRWLDGNLFPSAWLGESHLAAALDPSRIVRIEGAVRALGGPSSDPTLRYFTWDTPQPVQHESIDLVFSHVVLNHVNDLDAIYANCARWLRPGGWMSHQVDFSSLGATAEWNGHREHGELAWKLIAGRRPYFVGREPPAKHLELLERHGFETVELIRGKRAGGIGRDRLAPRWRNMSDEDLATQTCFFIARKRA